MHERALDILERIDIDGMANRACGDYATRDLAARADRQRCRAKAYETKP